MTRNWNRLIVATAFFGSFALVGIGGGFGVWLNLWNMRKFRYSINVYSVYNRILHHYAQYVNRFFQKSFIFEVFLLFFEVFGAAVGKIGKTLQKGQFSL